MVAASNQTAAHSPVYVVYGSDDYLRARKRQDLIENVLGLDPDDMSVISLDGDATSIADVLDECRTPSLLTPLRVVCVNDADKLLYARASSDGTDGRKGAAPVATNREYLEKYLKTPSSSGVLILVCRTWQKKTRLYKLVEEVGVHIACDPPKGRRGFVSWVATHSQQEFGCRIRDAAAERLVDLAGEDAGLLHMEMAKLATYVSPKTDITVEDVELMVGMSREEKVFGITDAIARRDPRSALVLWHQVLASDSAAPFRSVGGLAYGFRRLAEARRLMDQGLSVAAAARQAGIWGDFRSLGEQLQRFSLPQWQDQLTRLLQIDVGAKTGLGTVEASVEKLIVELCVAS